MRKHTDGKLAFKKKTFFGKSWNKCTDRGSVCLWVVVERAWRLCACGTLAGGLVVRREWVHPCPLGGHSHRLPEKPFDALEKPLYGGG